MSPETVIFPMCGLTYGDVLDAAARADNKRHAAKLLGVGEDHLYRAVKRHNLGHLFKRLSPRERRVTRDQVVELANQGFIRADVAMLLDISERYLKDLIKTWDIADEFVVRGGYANWVRRRGYAGG